jgi:hypothetical protein
MRWLLRKQARHCSLKKKSLSGTLIISELLAVPLSSDTRKRSQPKWQQRVTLLLPLVSVFLLIGILETLIRSYHFVRYKISFVDGQPTKSGELSPISLDMELGWRATESYRSNGKKSSADGTRYSVDISQDENGFRMFGNPSSDRLKVLVIGDSHTQAVSVSNDKTYYAVLKGLLDVEVFAYGASGYGSLQELMIFSKYFDRVRPDLVLWQYSANDLINNSPELEAASSINNNGLVRPYWINHRISYILPKKQGRGVRLFALQHCRICYMVLNRLDRLAAKIEKTVETETGIGGRAHAAFLRSLAVTDEIIEKVSKVAGRVPIVAFIVGGSSPFGPEYIEGLREISRRHNIIPLTDIDEAILGAEKKGAIVRAADGSHWNELGHDIAGRAIADSLRTSGLLNSR